MAYRVPGVEISQQFTTPTVFRDNPLPAFVFGSQYELFRYSVTAEKADINAGSYDFENDTTYTWATLGKSATAVVDLDYTRLFIDSAECLYFTELTGGSDTINHTSVPSASSYLNRIKASTTVWKTANGTDRSASLYTRDVQVGDVIKIDDGTTFLTSEVKELVADITASDVGDEAIAYSPQTTQTEDFNNAFTYSGSGSAPASITATNSSSAYKGHYGLSIFSDTYTVTITTGGTLASGNARATISSAEGAFADVTAVVVGTSEINIDVAAGNDVTITFSGAGTLVAGNAWDVTVTAPIVALTTADLTAAGTYTGTKDILYTVTVTRGGLFYTGSNGTTCAQATITSDDVDASGPVNVAGDTAFAAGSYGATFKIDDDNLGLFEGNIFTFQATAETAGAVKTIALNDNLTSTLLSAAQLNVYLYLVQNIEVPEVRNIVGPTYNFTQDANGITVESAITTTNSQIVDGDDLVSLAVEAGTVYVQHRDLLIINSTSIKSIVDPTDVEGELGPITPDNPLSQGVYLAALNSNGVPTYYCAVPVDTLTGYNAVLNLAKNTNKVYSFVPLTFDSTIRAAVVSHVNTYSTAQNAKWRIAWFSQQLVAEDLIYDLKTNGQNWTATVADNPLASGTQYTLVTISGATLITDGVRPGDQLFINFAQDAEGTITYDVYEVASITSQTTLLLTEGLPAAVITPTKIEINRIYDTDEQVNNYVDIVEGYKNRRVRVVFPDTVKNGTVDLDGFFAAAALAGLRAGQVPHQGLTNLPVLGFDDVSKTIIDFTVEQLNTLAEAGTWIITQEAVGSTPFVRHQLTTDPSSINTYEDSVTTNVDSISYGLQTALEPYIGKYNNNKETRALIRKTIEGQLLFRQTGTFTQQAGNQVISWDIVKLEPNLTFRDKLDVEITIEIPYPLNYIDVTLTV